MRRVVHTGGAGYVAMMVWFMHGCDEAVLREVVAYGIGVLC